MKKAVIKVLSLVVAFVLAFAVVASNAAAATSVSPSNMGGWVLQKTGDSSSDFVTGPGGVNSHGVGSVNLKNGSVDTQVASVYTLSYNSTKLNVLTSTVFEYYAYGSTNNGSVVNQPLVQLYVHTTDDGLDILTFDPNAQGAAINVNEWKAWNLNDGLWRSGDYGVTKTLDDYVLFVNGVFGGTPDDVYVTDQGLRFQVGPSVDIFDANVDYVTINGTTYDFEPDSTPSPSPSPSPSPATNNFQMQVYGDNNFQNPVGSPVPAASGANGTGNIFKLNYNWGSGAPQGAPVDNFSVRLTGIFDFLNNVYRFTSNTDNNIKIFVDGVEVLNKPTKGAGQGVQSVTAGVHTVTIEYVHATGNSILKASGWERMACYDMTADTSVNVIDLQQMAPHINLAGMNAWDIDGNNQVNVIDFQAAAAKTGQACPYNQ